MTLAPTVEQPKAKKPPKPKTYRSGWCSNGQHEGDKPVNFRGAPLPTCTCTSAECACKCHKMFDEIFEISGMPRVIQEISGYVAAPSPYVLPDRVSLMAERAEQRARSQHRHPDDTAVIGRHVFAPTPTGIRAPKQLEYQILDVLRSWIDPTFEWVPPDVKLVAHKIGTIEGRAPSVGAVHAVFTRWVKIEFAKYQNRPSKFLGFVGEGTPEELDALKKKHARAPARKRWNKDS